MHNFLGVFPKFLYKGKNGIAGSRKETRGGKRKIQFLEPVELQLAELMMMHF
jgi:hypothetical protein